MNPYDQAADDLGWEPQPMRRLPVIHSILYDVTQFKLSEWVVNAERDNLVRNGFTVTDITQTFDPMVGHKTEYWGYRHE